MRSAAREAVQSLLGEAGAHMVPDSALQRLHDLKTHVSEPPFLVDDSDFDRSAPAAEAAVRQMSLLSMSTQDDDNDDNGP